MALVGLTNKPRWECPLLGGKADMDGDPSFFGLLTLVEIDRRLETIASKKFCLS
jgi:hypothetical protein